ncbi:MAG: ABC transporter permease [Anaerolineaceae bacterium]|nr:ABC transporter permease [Anaerolineaceae bacterium]
MIARALRLVRQQVRVQFQVRLFNLYSFALYFIQPAIFSLVGMLLSRAAGNPRPDLIYTVIGSGVLGMWSGLVFSSLYDIRADRRDGTLELIVASPTSLGTVEAIRTMANVLTGLVSLLAAFIIAVLVFDYSFAGVNLAAVLVSLLVLLAGLWSLGVFLANFTVWSRLSGSYVEFLEIPVALVCGFMYPIRILPEWMQAVSTIFPIRWALEALDAALTGSHDLARLAECWGLGLLLSFLFWGVTRLLEGRVHDRIRVTGEMRSI